MFLLSGLEHVETRRNTEFDRTPKMSKNSSKECGAKFLFSSPPAR